MQNATARIKYEDIDVDELYTGEKGRYLNIVIWVNKEGPDKWGNDGFITQEISKRRRVAGERGPILGNFKFMKPRDGGDSPAPAPRAQPQQALPQRPQRPMNPNDDDLAF